MFLEYFPLSFINSDNLFHLVLFHEFCIVDAFWLSGTLHMRLTSYKIMHEPIQGVDL